MSRPVPIAALALLVACNPFAPATELEVLNDLNATLSVRAAPCGQPTEAFATLEPGESRTRNVEPGCWIVNGWTDDGRFGGVEVHVAQHALHRLPFHTVED